MTRIYWTLCLLAALLPPIAAQPDSILLFQLEDIVCKEQARGAFHLHEPTARNIFAEETDIRYQHMAWTIDPAVYFIRGEITYHFAARKEGIDQLVLDLSDELTVLDINRSGIPLTWTHGTDQLLRIDLGKYLSTGEADSLTVRYEGMPPSNGFGSFEQAMHNGAPIIWTLSEPYGVRDWWPGKQDLSDKIDSVDIYITTPAGQLAAGNGKLMSITPDGDQVVHHWRHRYPIASYLIALAVTNYEAYSHFLPLSATDTLEILNYVYPESRVQAETQTPRTLDFMELFNELFGTYPFADEKYGHAQFSWGGGMEHQTMSFMGNFGYELNAHELAHQWFGNKVTCGSWTDIWLNEGFATYLTGLSYERFSPDIYWPLWKRSIVNAATSQPGGSVFVDDTTSVSRIFSGRLSYSKGSYLLHMLRWRMGDEAFFGACRDYLDGPGTAFGFATTADLQEILEIRSGLDLDDFFADWFLGEGYPSYQVQWTREPDSLIILLHQTTSHPTVDFFAMPVPIHLYTSAGEMPLRLDHTHDGQRFSIPVSGFSIDSVKFDPDLWLLSRNNTIEELITSVVEPDQTAYSVSPNPVRDVLYLHPAPLFTRVMMTDLTGRSFVLPVTGGRVDVSRLAPGYYGVFPAPSGSERFSPLTICIIR